MHSAYLEKIFVALFGICLQMSTSLLTVKSARRSVVGICPGDQSAAGVLWGNPGNLFYPAFPPALSGNFFWFAERSLGPLSSFPHS